MRLPMRGFTIIPMSPVSLPDGTVAGTLYLIHPSPRDFPDEDIANLRDLACIVEDEFHAISMAMTDSLTGSWRSERNRGNLR